jgi:cation transporter-like permease
VRTYFSCRFPIGVPDVVHQKKLGVAAAVASAMTRFDPDATRTPLPPP